MIRGCKLMAFRPHLAHRLALFGHEGFLSLSYSPTLTKWKSSHRNRDSWRKGRDVGPFQGDLDPGMSCPWDRTNNTFPSSASLRS